MKKLFIILLSIISAFSIYADSALKEMYIMGSGIIKLSNLKELIHFSYYNTQFLLMLIVSIALIIFYKKYLYIPKKRGYKVLSLIFSLFTIFGYSYSISGTTYLVFGNFLTLIISIIRFITYFFFISTILQVITNYLLNLDLTKFKLNKRLEKFKNYYERHPYKVIIIVLLLAWLPYIISFYPGILSPDPANQIKQYFGFHTHYVDGVNLIDPNILITNHHPVFHTFILGGFTKIGSMLGSVNLGIFMFTCFQIYVLISAFSYMLVYLKNCGVPFIYQFVLLLILAFVPVFPFYALSPVKDTIFAALFIFYIIELHKLLANKPYRLTNYIGLGLLLLIMMLIRNNAIYVILFSFLIFIFILKAKRGKLILTLVLSLFIYYAHNNIILPIMHITPGSIRETLSVPFQATARYVKYYGAEVTDYEKKVIDKVLGYDDLAERYEPNLADKVKNAFNKDAGSEDLKAYFKVWFMCFFKHPLVYVDALLNTTYGYFYPNTSNWYIYHEYDERLIEVGLDYHYNALKVPRGILTGIGVSFPYIPLLGSIVNIGFIVWIYLYLLTFMIVEKKRKLIPLLAPAFVLLLTILVGPVNTYFRYIFPIMASLPLIIGLLYNSLKKPQ